MTTKIRRSFLTSAFGAAVLTLSLLVAAVGPASAATPQGSGGFTADPIAPMTLDRLANNAARLTDVVAQASDQYAAFAALTPNEQKAVLDYTALASVTTQPSQLTRVSGLASAQTSAAAVSCWTWTWGREGRNVFGVTLWTFTQRIDWCGNGTTITSIPFRQVIGTPRFLWWSYLGLVGDSTGGGKAFESYRSFVQGHFSYRPPNPFSNQDNNPWLDMTAHADGRGTGSGGG